MEAFNTLDASKRLAEAGCEQSVADAVVREINGAIIGNVATKTDLERLEERLLAKFEGHEARFEGLEAKFEGLEAKLEGMKNYLLYRVVALQIATIGLLFALIRFFG